MLYSLDSYGVECHCLKIIGCNVETVQLEDKVYTVAMPLQTDFCTQSMAQYVKLYVYGELWCLSTMMRDHLKRAHKGLLFALIQ